MKMFSVELASLQRHYAAQSPNNPALIPSPPFPTNHWLTKQNNQRELYNTLVVNNNYNPSNWHRSFWKRIINQIEVTQQNKKTENKKQN